MPELRKITEVEFNAKLDEECTQAGKTPYAKLYDGNLPVRLTFADYDLPIAAGTYKSLLFVPCELIGEFNWIRGLSSKYVVGLQNGKVSPNGPRKPRTITPGEFKIIELENHGVLFAFV